MKLSAIAIVICILSFLTSGAQNVEFEKVVRISSSTPTLEFFDNASAENRLEGRIRELANDILFVALEGDLLLTAADNMSLNAFSGDLLLSATNAMSLNANFGYNFKTNDINRMTINSSGDVGIGGTSGLTKFTVVSENIGIWARTNSAIGIIGDTNNPNDFDFLAETSDGSNGYGTTSSIRWKTNIHNIDDPIIKLSQLRGVYYNWKEEFGGNYAVGFIAEEVGKVLPEIVVYEDNGIDATGLDYSKMTPLLVEAANAMREEYQEKFDDQQSEIDALKQEMIELRTLLKEQVKNVSED